MRLLLSLLLLFQQLDLLFGAELLLLWCITDGLFVVRVGQEEQFVVAEI